MAPSFAAIERLRALDIDRLEPVAAQILPARAYGFTRATLPVRTRRDPFTYAYKYIARFRVEPTCDSVGVEGPPSGRISYHVPRRQNRDAI